MKKATKLFCFALALAQVMALASCGSGDDTSSAAASTASGAESGSETASQYPDYLNLDSATPLVKEGEEPITLKVLTSRVDSNCTTDISEIRWIPFAEDLLNVKFELEDAHQNAEERISLMFSTNDLPDMCWGLGVSTSQMVTYGQGEGMLLVFSQYLNEELRPNAYECMQKEENQIAFEACKLNDGSMYTIPRLLSTNYLDNSTIATHRVFINKNWLEGVGRTEAPASLDDFVQMLREFKEQDPMGKGDANVPYLGLTDLVFDYLWNALGFIGSYGYGTGAALYQNQVEIPCASEQYREFVTTMNTLYNEGLISQDFFTMDDVTMRAYIVEGDCGVIADWAPYLSSPDTFKDWISAAPLTSDYQETPLTGKSSDYSIGTVFASATTEYPELVCRFFDYLYTPDGYVNFQNGPAIGQSDAVEGLWTVEQNEDGQWEQVWPLVDDGSYSTSYEVKYQIGAIAQHICGNEREIKKGEEIITGHASDVITDMENADTFYRYTVDEAYGDYLTDNVLPAAYLDEETSSREVDLRTVIQNYVQQETARFITGARPLEEVDAYFEELKNLGIDEYKQIYVDAYAGFIESIQ